MSRYLLFSLCIGVGAALLASVAHLLGAFSPFVESLESLYTAQGVFLSGDVTRLVWLELLLILLAALGISWAVIDLPGFSQKALVVLCGILLLAFLSPVLALHNWMFEPFSSGFAILLASLGGFVFSKSSLGMRKQVLAGLLGPRVSHGRFLEMMNRREEPNWRASSREVTVLSCRFVNGKELAEELSSEDLAAISNFFLRSVKSFLLQQGAYLDEAGPEMIRGCFGLFDGEVGHEEAACRAALSLRGRLKNLSRECEARWFHPLVFGIGVETGHVTAGVFGDRDDVRYTALGTVIDLSRRLSGANPDGVEGVVLGPEVFARSRDRFEVRPLEMFFSPESGQLHEIYQLLDAKESFTDEARAGRDLFWKGMIFLREKRHEEALEAFSRSRALSGYDSTVDYFVTRMQELVAPSQGRKLETLEENPEKGHARLINRL